MLISMHTYNLLTEHADRSTIVPDQLPLLDQFLVDRKVFNNRCCADCRGLRFTPEQTAKPPSSIISGCFRRPTIFPFSPASTSAAGHLLHPLPLRDGGTCDSSASAGPRHFVLDPYPFAEPSLSFQFPARYGGKNFLVGGGSAAEFSAASRKCSR